MSKSLEVWQLSIPACDSSRGASLGYWTWLQQHVVDSQGIIIWIEQWLAQVLFSFCSLELCQLGPHSEPWKWTKCWSDLNSPSSGRLLHRPCVTQPCVPSPRISQLACSQSSLIKKWSLFRFSLLVLLLSRVEEWLNTKGILHVHSHKPFCWIN